MSFTARLDLRIPKELKEELELYCLQNNLSEASTVRLALREFLDKKKLPTTT